MSIILAGDAARGSPEDEAGPLGPAAAWPEALRTLAAVVRAARQPMLLAWSADRVLLVNRTLADALGWGGEAHGQVPPDRIETLSPLLDRAYAGEAIRVDDLAIPPASGNGPAPLRFALSLTPVRDGDGAVSGAFGTLEEIGDHAAARDNAREAERKLEFALLAGDAAGTWDWDIDKDVVYANPAFAALFGVDADRAAKGAPLPDYLQAIHPEDRDEVVAAIDRAVRTGEDYRFEYRVVGADGAVRWVLAQGRTVRGPDGRPSRFPGVAVEITERKSAEAALRESEARYQLAQEAAHIGVYDWDIDCDTIVWDARLRELWGVGPDDPIDFRTFLDGVHRDDVTAVEKAVRAGLDPAGSGRYEAEYRVVNRRNRSVRWVHAIGRVSFDVGRPVRLIGAAIDVTARREAEDKLRQSERRLRLALDAAEMGAWDIEEGADVGFIDAGMTRFFGLPETADRMPIDWFYQLTHPDDRDEVARRVREAWETGGEFAAEFRLVLGSRERWLVGRGRVLDGDGGRRMYGVNYDVTAVKKAEESLRRSEEMRRLALEGAALGTWDIDLVSGETQWDARTREIFGIGADEPACLDRGMALIHPDDRDAARRAYETSVAPGGSGTYAQEKRIVRPGGSVRWVATNGRVIFAEDGRPVRMVGVVRDVTKRRRSEAALKASEERLRVAVDSLPIVVWQQDRDLRYTWVQNPRLGLDSSIVGKTDHEILPASEASKVVPLKRRVLESGEGLRREIDITVADRTEIYEFALEPMVDQGGAVIGITGAAHDVTALRRTARSLAASEARFRTMTEAMPQMVWSARPDGHHDFFNARWSECTGLSSEESEGFGWRAVFHPDDREEALEHWSRCLASGEAYDRKHRLRDRSGDFRWVLSRAISVRDESGRIDRWMGTSTDVHEMEKAREHLKLLVDELNHRVKNTLAIVQGLAQQSFAGEEVPETARKAFEGRLAALAGAHTLLTREHWEKVSLAELAADALQPCGLLRDRVALAGPPVVLRPNQAVTFAMALHELCTNAVKYGALSTDTGTIDISWSLCGDSDRTLCLVWRETGGPPVDPPRRRGFGSRMIERALAYELSGEAALYFHPEGLVCEIRAALPAAP